jgi:uncharacterized protein with HEPN domain
MSRYKLYINVILETISKIEKSILKIEKSKFLKDKDIQDATLMRLQVIGENIKKIPSSLKNKQVNWKKFEKLRNLISHRYDVVDYEIVYSFIKNNLSELKKAINEIKNE